MSFELHREVNAKPIRVFLVDDHDIVRQCLKDVLAKESDIRICGEAAELITAVERIDALRPDILLVDLQLGKQNGTELLCYVQERWIGMKTIVVSQHDPALVAGDTRKAGAWGYICKEEAASHVVPAIRAVYQGTRYDSPRAAAVNWQS